MPEENTPEVKSETPADLLGGSPPPEDTKPKTTRAKKPVEARVLQDCAYGAVDTVAIIPGEELGDAKANGLVDDHPDAVAYVKGLSGSKA